MDLSQTFEYGQGYVALSRVRTLAGLILSGLNARALEVHPDIQNADVGFKDQSIAAENSFEKLSKKELSAMHDRFVLACSGRKAEKTDDGDEDEWI